MTVEARVKRIVSEQTGFDVEAIKPGSHLQRDLRFDTLDDVEVLMALEDEFNIAIADEDAEKLATVGQIIEYVSKRAA